MRLKLADQLNSISVKVLLAFIVGMVLSVSLIALVLLVALGFQKNILSENDINDFSGELAESLQFNAAGVPVRIADEEYLWLFESLYSEIAFRVVDQSGKVALSSTAGPEFWSAVDLKQPIKAGPFEFIQNGIMMDAANGMRVHDERVWFIQVAVSRRFMFFAHHTFALRFIEDGLILLSLVLFVIFGACAHFTLRHTLKPLRQLSESAALISPRSLQARLKDDDIPAEIVPLVKSFNTVLDRVEHGYRVQQEFLATAAHELKTPLALISAQLELMPSTEQRNWLLHDVRYMSRQVQQLLLLAEASEQQNYRFITLDVTEIAAEVVAYLQRMADNQQVTLRLERHIASLILPADKGALFTLLKNLLENAIQHAPADSTVAVDVFADNISVRDQGTGVSEAQLPQLFNRFWRAEARRDSGAGLGLTICREIALAHGWVLSAHRMQPGLQFRLQLVADK
ncbi:two-component sensor histidine kinase [Rheinheimera sp. YQF-2]|uniref:histidine kinase n=1 Tax=Rheinheimera lutimaris TaxID=2740584 RepID=A0A7Y5ASE0_9GAMM|nr:ATP-binding protein [Rheinheimera lutimaris]NRQ43160.1 two-component sensor histidine kinase [Rheinheimera lutimaris]